MKLHLIVESQRSEALGSKKVQNLASVPERGPSQHAVDPDKDEREILRRHQEAEEVVRGQRHTEVCWAPQRLHHTHCYDRMNEGSQSGCCAATQKKKRIRHK